MAIVVKPYTFSAGATIVAAEHNNNFDTLYSDYNGNISTANLAAAAGITSNQLAGSIVDSKLSTISTAGKVQGSALTILGGIPAGGGTIPVANLPAGTATNQVLKILSGGQLPLIDGSLLTNVTISNAIGMITLLSQSSYVFTVGGLGFQPVFVEFVQVRRDEAGTSSIGWDNSVNHYCIYSPFAAGVTGFAKTSTSYSFKMERSVGTSEVKGYVSSFISDGFTVSVTNISFGESLTLMYKATR